MLFRGVRLFFIGVTVFLLLAMDVPTVFAWRRFRLATLPFIVTFQLPVKRLQEYCSRKKRRRPRRQSGLRGLQAEDGSSGGPVTHTTPTCQTLARLQIPQLVIHYCERIAHISIDSKTDGPKLQGIS